LAVSTDPEEMPTAEEAPDARGRGPSGAGVSARGRGAIDAPQAGSGTHSGPGASSSGPSSPGAVSPSSFDAIVVGAGPAGTSAALGLTQTGAKVLLLERGEYPGAKNMFGGMMAYCPAAEELLPGFYREAPWERAVTKRVLS